MGMSSIEREVPPRKAVVMFFIIDTSGSMAGTRIGAVDSAMEEALKLLKEMNAENADAEIEIAILEFASQAKWLTPNGPVKVENYHWRKLDVEGLTAMDEAFRMLDEKLRKDSGFMKRATGSYAPVLFLMTDGEPNDEKYKAQLAQLKDNAWFKVSTKVALAIGDDANDHVLEEFTGSREAVIKVPDGANAGAKLVQVIRFVAVTSSQVASTPADASGKTKQQQLQDAIQTAVDDDDWDVGGASAGDDLDW